MKINYLFLSSLFACFAAFNLSAQVSFGMPQLLNDHWKFRLGEIDLNSNYEVSKWQAVDLPHDWSVEQQLSPSLASCTGYLPGGIGWYHNTIRIPETRKGEKAYLYFEGVYNRSEVYINGELLGKRPNGYISFMYDITPYLQYGSDNVILVRVDHSQSADSRWYTGSGIYRNVWLVYADPIHIGQWGVFAYPEVKGNRGVLHTEVEVDNGSDSEAGVTIVNELFDAAGKKVATGKQTLNLAAGKTGKVNLSLTVNKPQLWNLDNPVLYQLRTTVLKNGKTIDQTATMTGFRTFSFDPNKGFALNGEWMKVKGVCIHHDAGVLGAAVPREVWKRRLLILKEIGVNAVRTSHNPQAPDLYELCDELGMLVLNEMYDEWVFPKRKWIEGWNVGTPGFQGSFDIFKEWGEKDLADFVRRDRNHLSVFAWSIGNEVDYPNDPYSHPVLGGDKATGFVQASYGGYNPDAPDAMQLGDIAKRLTATVKRYDPSRPTTAGLAGVAMSNQTEYPGALDIAGYNYTESHYDTDHVTYPNRVIYGSENSQSMSAWKAARDREYIFGQFLWTGFDYLGEAGRWPSRGLYTGLVDFAGFIKPRGFFRQSLWSDKPMMYIGTYPIQRVDDKRLSQDAWPIWNYSEDQLIRVVCYTNAAKAKLNLNGREVGPAKEYDDNTGIIYWDIPYEAGSLEAVGMDKDGNEVSRHLLRSSSQPVALRITKADTEIHTDKGLAQIQLQVVDTDGIPVMLSDNEVTCQIEGPARLLGLEAGNNSDMSDYTDNKHRVFHGNILAYVQATGEPGRITVKFTSPWLKPVVHTIENRVASIRKNIPLDSILLSDPAILADANTKMYYMTGTGGRLWKSKDLRLWEGPFQVVEQDKNSWMGENPNIWAAELHAYRGKYYYFATFTNHDLKVDTLNGRALERRASHVLRSEQPDGPYVPMNKDNYLPAELLTLDGTFWVDKDRKPYMIYCHEWLQNNNGTMEKIELKPDLSGSVGKGKILFKASDSPWSREKINGETGPNRVTDGPYLFRTGTGRLGMIWTSWVYNIYTQGVAYSESGTLDGPWIQEKEPITPPNFGHGMLFRTFKGKDLMSVHSHKEVDGRTIRIPHLFEVDLSGDKLVVKGLLK